MTKSPRQLHLLPNTVTYRTRPPRMTCLLFIPKDLDFNSDELANRGSDLNRDFAMYRLGLKLNIEP